MTRPPALNADQREVLAALGLYHLMTVEQLQRVGAANGSKRRVEAALTLLIRKHLVSRKEAETIAYKDRLPAVHWLVPKGAAELGDGQGSERRFRGVSQTRHRMAIVDVHIALREWAHEAGAGVTFVADFEPAGARQPKPTTLLYAGHKFSPDALAGVELPGGERLALALEVERGGAIEDRNPFRDGLPHWRGVAEDEVMENVLGLDRPARFLMVFQSAEMRRKALGDWAKAEPAAPVWRRFYCKGLDELGPDFGAGWWQPNGAQSALFHELPA